MNIREKGEKTAQAIQRLIKRERMARDFIPTNDGENEQTNQESPKSNHRLFYLAIICLIILIAYYFV